HPLVEKITTPAQDDEVRSYQEQAKRQSDIQRESVTREKTGVFTGGYAVNPVSGQHIPIWVADYVLMSYGTGAIMAVPAHGMRDCESTRQFVLPIKTVSHRNGQVMILPDVMTEAVEPHGSMVISGPLAVTREEEWFVAAGRSVEELGVGKSATDDRWHDWLIS